MARDLPDDLSKTASNTHDDGLHGVELAPPPEGERSATTAEHASSTMQASMPSGLTTLWAATVLAACGGGSDDASPTPPSPTPPSPTPPSPTPPSPTPPSPTPPSPTPPSPTPPSPTPPSPTPPSPPPPTPAPPPAFKVDDASRLLGQASFGASRAEVERVQGMGPDAWLQEQFNAPTTTSHVQWLRDKGYETEAFQFNRAPLDYTLWRKALTGTDVLRQRVVHALAQIFVVSVEGVGGDFPHFAVGRYLDILETHAFGNYRALLEDVTLSLAMGRYLSMRASRRADTSGRRPDENYAREVMQLFSIGLNQLNVDGTPRLVNGQPAPSYDEADVSGLARVFTGWDFGAPASTTSATRVIVPMTNTANFHETGVKTFLGTTIPAGTSATESLRIALDTIANHPNVGPFIGRQLIQRLVSSNPSAAYVGRVAAAFNNNGSGVRGDLRATVRAVLTDAEARDTQGASTSTTRGKLREPVMRFAQWARIAGVTSASDAWRLGNLSDPATRLGQSPLHSPSVFNFYRPGYVPPSTPIASNALVAPEFQITTETSVAGYLNFMQTCMSSTTGFAGSDLVPNYTPWLAMANDPAALVAEMNLLFAANQLQSSTVTTITNAIAAMSGGTDALRLQRIRAAMLLTMAAPDYLIQR